MCIIGTDRHTNKQSFYLAVHVCVCFLCVRNVCRVPTRRCVVSHISVHSCGYWLVTVHAHRQYKTKQVAICCVWLVKPLILTLMVLSLRPLTIFLSSYWRQYTPLLFSLWHSIRVSEWWPLFQLNTMRCGPSWHRVNVWLMRHIYLVPRYPTYSVW